jgi:hypothetical protein
MLFGMKFAVFTVGYFVPFYVDKADEVSQAQLIELQYEF